jgi:5S rRNA maturation endonuclease (ribonuclease M5)
VKVTINIKAGVVIVEGKTDEENNHQFWAQALAIAETMVATTAHPTSALAAKENAN